MKEYDVRDLKREEKAKIYEQVAIDTMIQKKAWDSSTSLEEAINIYNDLKSKINNRDKSSEEASKSPSLK